MAGCFVILVSGRMAESSSGDKAGGEQQSLTSQLSPLPACRLPELLVGPGA